MDGKIISSFFYKQVAASHKVNDIIIIIIKYHQFRFSASSKSSESLFSASSINSKTRILHRRSHSGFISLASPHTSDVRQRVLSARQHRFRALQNKLNEVLQENAVRIPNPFLPSHSLPH